MGRRMVWLAVGGAVVLGFLAVPTGGACIWERSTQARDQRELRPPGRLVDIGGRRLHIACLSEDKPGPTVVLEAGGGNPGILDQPLARRIGEFAPVCWYDRAGFGWSDPDPRERTFEMIADDLDRLLKAAGAKPPYVLEGASFGGLAVRAYARAHPEKVAGLVLTDAAEEVLIFSNYEALVQSGERMARVARPAAALGLIRRAVLGGAESLGLPEHLRAEDRRILAAQLSRADHWRAAGKEALAYQWTPANMRRAGGFGDLADKPLIVLAHGKPMAGFHSALEPGWLAGQQRLATLSSRGQLQVVAGAGHAIGIERPDVVARAVFNVVQQVRSAEIAPPQLSGR